MDPKEKILQLLDQSGNVVSGARLSAALGISRVAVWKHIQGLLRAGLPIVTSSRGYRLSRDGDHLVAWDRPEWHRRLHLFEALPSTMDAAMGLAREGCPDFTVVVAERQTQGRGRMQRTWVSADGGLYFTVIVRPRIPLAMVGLVNLAAAVEMAALLRQSHGVDARLKWPNDILVQERKICGILSQVEAEGEQVAHMNIGIGLNVNNRPEVETPVALSLKALLGRSVPRREILVGFLDRFHERLTDFDPAAVMDQWRSLNATLGRPVRIVTFKETVEGTAEDVDAHGGLVLRLADGGCRTVIHGDCFHA